MVISSGLQVSIEGSTVGGRGRSNAILAGAVRDVTSVNSRSNRAPVLGAAALVNVGPSTSANAVKGEMSSSLWAWVQRADPL